MMLPPVRLSRGLKLGLPLLAGLFAVDHGADGPALAGAGGFVALIVVSTALHEFGHVAAVRLCGLEVDGVTLTLFGGATRYSGPIPTRTGRAAIAAAGPLASAFLAVACLAAWVISGGENEATVLSGLCGAGAMMNIGVTVINLLPVPTLDGGRIVSALFGRRLRA